MSVQRGIKRKQQFNDTNKAKRVKSSSSKEYVVEKILQHKVEGGKQLFLVKWKNYGDNRNTWEPLEHLENCPKILLDFFTENVGKQILDALLKKLNISNNQLKKQTLLKMLGIVDLNDLPDKLMLLQKLLVLVATPPKDRHARKLEEGKRAILSYQLVLKREAQVDKLKKWEAYINNEAKEDAIIRVENDVDLEEPPHDFVYINDNIAGKNVKLPTKAKKGCKCEECGPRLKECCGRQDPNSFTYRYRDKINIIPGMAIYECNDMCKCGPDCRNRIVQKGRKIPLCIFRTNNGCGWGVKTLRKIFQGEFIIEYVGEVITHEEAEIRGQTYDAKGRTYLFDLDFHSNDNPYTIDAAKYGNLSHFINHSCEPNLAVWSVWINSSDPNLPRLAMFSLRDIQKGEELTFDYMSNYAGSPSNTPDKSKPKLKTPEKNDNTANGKASLCRCSADSCRRYLFA